MPGSDRVKREQGAECRLDHARSDPMRIDLRALRTDGTVTKPECALAPARPAAAELALAPARPALRLYSYTVRAQGSPSYSRSRAELDPGPTTGPST